MRHSIDVQLKLMGLKSRNEIKNRGKFGRIIQSTCSVRINGVNTTTLKGYRKKGRNPGGK